MVRATPCHKCGHNVFKVDKPVKCSNCQTRLTRRRDGRKI